MPIIQSTAFNFTPSLAAFGWIDWLVIAVYMLIMIAIGALASRGQADEHTYFQGSRRMPTWAVMLSVLATALSAATFVGVPQLSFTGNLSYLIHVVAGIFGGIVVALVILPPLYRAGTITIYGYLEHRYGPTAVIAASVAFLGGRLLASGARLYIAGVAFSPLLPNEYGDAAIIIAIILLGIIGTIYTVFGGIKAVIWTDVVQIFVVIGAAIASVVLLSIAIPISFDEMFNLFAKQGKLKIFSTGFEDGGGYDWANGGTFFTMFALTFFYASAFGVDHDLVQRMLTTKSAWRAGASIIGSTLLTLPVVLLFLAIGLLLSIFYGMPEIMGDRAPTDALNASEKVYPQFLVNQLPTGLAGLAMAGMFAAAMSSFDSAVNAMSGNLVADFAPNSVIARVGHLKASRIAVVFVGIALIYAAVAAVIVQRYQQQSLIDFALGVMTFAYAGLLAVFLAAILTKRGSALSAISALIVGALIVLCLQPYVLGTVTKDMFGEPFLLAMPWWLPIASTIAFVICIIPRGNSASRNSRDSTSRGVA